MKRDDINFEFFDEAEATENSLRGNNFLVSAVMLLKRQRKDLSEENRKLKEQLDHLEQQNAALLNVSADRLLHPNL